MPSSIRLTQLIFNRSTLIVSFVSVISGCAGVQAQEEVKQAMTWCENRVNGDQAIHLLKNKLPLARVDEITPDMLSIADIPSEQEVVSIRAWSVANTECRKRALDIVRKYQPTALSTLEATYYKYDLIAANLMERKISYGNANRLAKEAYLEGMNEYTERAQKEMAQARQLELQRAQVLLQASAVLNQQSQTPAPPQHTITNCRWVGKTLNCTSF